MKTLPNRVGGVPRPAVAAVSTQRGALWACPLGRVERDSATGMFLTEIVTCLWTMAVPRRGWHWAVSRLTRSL